MKSKQLLEHITHVTYPSYYQDGSDLKYHVYGANKDKDLINEILEDDSQDLHGLIVTAEDIGFKGIGDGLFGEPGKLGSFYVLYGNYLHGDKFIFVFTEIPEDAPDDLKDYYLNIGTPGIVFPDVAKWLREDVGIKDFYETLQHEEFEEQLDEAIEKHKNKFIYLWNCFVHNFWGK